MRHWARAVLTNGHNGQLAGAAGPHNMSDPMLLGLLCISIMLIGYLNHGKWRRSAVNIAGPKPLI